MTVRSIQTPNPTRPKIVRSYGISTGNEGLMEWDWVDQRMAKSRNYWIASTRPGGAPHIAPVWGVWLDGFLYFGGARDARRTRNLLADPRVVAHLESGDEVVIIEGLVEEVTDREMLRQVNRAMGEKYFPGQPEPELAPDTMGTVTFKVVPKVVLAWLEKDYPRTATRWAFEE